MLWWNRAAKGQITSANNTSRQNTAGSSHGDRAVENRPLHLAGVRGACGLMSVVMAFPDSGRDEQAGMAEAQKELRAGCISRVDGGRHVGLNDRAIALPNRVDRLDTKLPPETPTGRGPA